MAKYIEREAISEEIRKYYYKNPPNSSYGKGFDRGLDRAQRAILDAPAADVVPVVRCKNCIHYDLGVCLKIYSDGNTHPEAWQPRRLEDFCSYGERKEEVYES